MFDFSQEVDRRGTWCTQWDYVADRFGEADLLPFTISDMDFATAPCILEALNQRLSHGVLGYSRWKNEAFLGAITHWFATRHQTTIDAHSLVYGPSVIYMASELIRQWSDEGDGVVVHTPLTMLFIKRLKATIASSLPSRWRKKATPGIAIWPNWRRRWRVRKAKSCCCAVRKIPPVKCGRVTSWKRCQRCASAMAYG